MGISPTSSAALCGYKGFVIGHIGHYLSALHLAYYRSARNEYDKVFALFAVSSAARTGLTVGGFIFALIAKIRQCCKIVVNLKNNVSALAAVAAIRPSGGNIFFSVKRDCAVAAVARFNFNFRYIYKHNNHHSLSANK